MNTIYLILLLIAAGCFVSSAFGAALRQINLVALGLFFWVLVPLIQAAKALN